MQPHVRAQEPLQALRAVHKVDRVPVKAQRRELVRGERRRLDPALVARLEPRIDARLAAERLGRVDAEPVERLVVLLALRDERAELRVAEARLDRVDVLPVRDGHAEEGGLEDLLAEPVAVVAEPVDDVGRVAVEAPELLELLVGLVVETLQPGGKASGAVSTRSRCRIGEAYSVLR